MCILHTKPLSSVALASQSIEHVSTQRQSNSPSLKPRLVFHLWMSSWSADFKPRDIVDCAITVIRVITHTLGVEDVDHGESRNFVGQLPSV